MNKTSTRVVALAAAFLIGLAGWLALQSGQVAHAILEQPPAGASTGHTLVPGGVVIDLDALRPDDAAITFVCCAYNPTVVTITVGESVSWSGSFAFPHPLQQVDGPASDALVPGGFGNATGSFYSVQFNIAGEYFYRCGVHGQAQFGGTMRGKIIVLPSGGSTATPTATTVPPTATPTLTPVPPSATPTATALSPTETPTPTATLVADPVPTDTPTATPTSTSTPTLVPVAFLPAVFR